MPRDHHINTNTLVEQSYWDRSYAAMRPVIAGPEDRVRQWIETHVPAAQGEKHVLEVGCFPGRYLGVFGLMGYVVHGIDLSPAVRRMKTAFDEMGLRTGEFVETDFLLYEPSRQYDLVCSFGFIEHFTEWEQVLLAHARMVRPGGLLVVETPNFRGLVQHTLHCWLDTENYRRHHIPAMQPHRWAELLRAADFHVEQVGWFGRFEFWHDTTHHGPLHKIGFRILRVLQPWFRSRPEGGPSLSPYCGIIARKRQVENGDAKA